MKELQLTHAGNIPSATLRDFLSKFYSKAKVDFLSNHGNWWHSGAKNRWVLTLNNDIAGYCAIIPTRVNLGGETIQAIWWVDLIIAPEHRGRGYQSLFDEKITKMPELKLGFPNELAAKIHHKHGWGVRGDLETLLLPLKPTQTSAVQNAKGFRGIVLRMAATGLKPWSSYLQWRLKSYQPKKSRKVALPSPEVMAGIYHRYHDDEAITTVRDEAYMRWRYLEAPYRDELTFYLTGPADAPSHYLVTRNLKRPYGLATRILDFYGDFSDRDRLTDLLKTALQDSIRAGATQATVLISKPELKPLFRSLGFLIGTKTRFCWYSDDPALMDLISGKCHWTLADSDNDEPK